MGSYFAEQCRDIFDSYPFLELICEPGSGKSTLLEFLWKLSGRTNYEGFDPVKSTPAGISRNLAQVANLPVVFIEADHGDNSARNSFDWDQFKTAYNGRPIRSTGIKNNQNDTKEPLFRGALVISQNKSIVAEEATLERIIHIFNSRSNHTSHSREAVDKLKQFSINELSGFMIKAISKEQEILTLLKSRQLQHEQWLKQEPQIRKERISLNHAQICSLVEALAFVVDITPTQIAHAHELIKSLAIEREHT